MYFRLNNMSNIMLCPYNDAEKFVKYAKTPKSRVDTLTR